MSNLDTIQYILNSGFLASDKSKLIERQSSFNMEIPIKNDGCNFLSYKYDKDLKDYKGGLFPFFSQNEGVQKISDYVIFTEKGNQFYVLLIELKRGKESTLKQLEASKSFVLYIINTVRRVKKVTINPQMRYISISEFKRLKKGTREKPIKYDKNHTDFKGTTFRLKSFLK